MKTLLSRCPLLLLLLLLISCRSAAPEVANRMAVLAVRYLEDTRELRGQLSLFAGDSLATAQPLRFPGQVAFLGSGTREAVLPGSGELSATYRYETTLRADYPTDLRFSFPGPESFQADRQTIELRMAAPDLNAFPDTIRRSTGIQFTTPADSLRSSESILLFFSNVADESVRRVLVAGPTRSERISVPRGALEQLQPGTYRLYLVKSQQVNRKEDHLHTRGSIEYYTREKEVVVRE